MNVNFYIQHTHAGKHIDVLVYSPISEIFIAFHLF
jgi:hypothetical protein